MRGRPYPEWLWAKLVFFVGLAAWALLLVNEVQVYLSRPPVLSVLDFASYRWPTVFGWKIGRYFEWRINMGWHGTQWLPVCLVAVPFLLQWGWGRGAEKSNHRLLFGISVLLVSVPAIAALGIVLQAEEWQAVSMNCLCRALFIVLLLPALAFLPGVRSRRPAHQVLAVLAAGATFLLSCWVSWMIGGENPGNDFRRFVQLNRNYEDYVSSVLGLFYWLPNWMAALFAGWAVVAACSSRECPRSWPRHLTVVLLAGGCAGIIVGMAMRAHKVLLPLRDNRRQSVPVVKERFSVQHPFKPAAVRWIKNKSTGALTVPCVLYEVDMNLPAADYVEIEPKGNWDHRGGRPYGVYQYQSREYQRQQRWQWFWWSRQVRVNHVPKTRLTFLLTGPLDASEWPRGQGKPLALELEFQMEITEWKLHQDWGKLNPEKITAASGCSYVDLGTPAYRFMMYKPRLMKSRIIFPGLCWSRLWQPPLLCRSFEERSYDHLPNLPLRTLVGDFSSGALVGFGTYARPILPYTHSELEGWRRRGYRPRSYSRTEFPVGTPLERTQLQDGDYLYRGDLFRDIDRWWEAMEARTYEMIGSGILEFKAEFIVPEFDHVGYRGRQD